MTPSPSAGDAAKLVEELRALSAYPGDAYDRAADALEAQTREHTELQERFDHIVAVKDVHADKRFEATERAETAEARSESLSRDLAEARAALEPFVRAFDTAREKHGRRYGKDAAVGLKNFDKMPDRWPMDHLTFDMGTFRRARSVLPQKENHDV